MDASDLSRFLVGRFTPNLYNGWIKSGCGANTLALLTGVHPHKISNSNKEDQRDWKDRFMVRFLMERSFRVMKVDIKNLVMSNEYLSTPLQDEHVVMASHRLGRKEASWIVIHGGLFYHNFCIHKLGGLELINHPILTAYVVNHRRWLRSPTAETIR
jgi:hypothetical protein